MTAADSFARGVTLRANGDAREAAMAFLMAFALEPKTDAYRAAAFDVLNVMDGYRALPASVMAALAQTVGDPRLDLQPLSLVVRNLLGHDDRLPILQNALQEGDVAAEAALGNAAWLLTHPLLIPVLTRAVNISLSLETAFTVLRRYLCESVAAQRHTTLLVRYRDAVIAMAHQCVTNRYAWAETTAETSALDRLRNRSDGDAILVRSAYRPLHKLNESQVALLPASLAQRWHEEADERQRINTLQTFTPLTPGLSAAMQSQYEAHPYPRWRTVHMDARQSLHQILTQSIPGVAFDAALERDVDVLVAGCGTGQPALRLALGLTNARVLGVDISRASLAYAARKADELGARNISFGIGDILMLESLPQRFDFIDCSGVLHHMADPAAGLQVLRRMLRPHGVLMVALYSARGRIGEVAGQEFVRNGGFADTPAGMRAARTALAALPASHPARAVVDTLDFFTLDGLHDLIFNLHESRTSPAAMKQLLAACGLKAIGVNAHPNLGGNAFKAAHPNPADWANLDLWEDFEARHPHVFAHMIGVWCRLAVDER